MAVTRIKAYHTESSMHNGLNYSADPGKANLQGMQSSPFMETATDEANGTLLKDSMPADTSSPSAPDIKLSRVFSYTVNPDKTHIGTDGDVDILISGHHCNPDLAETDFKRCRGLYYMNGHKEHTGYAKAKRPLRTTLGEDGKPVLDENGRIVYDEKAPIYKDPSTGKVVYQQYQKKKEARTAYMWVMSFPGEKELGYELDPRLVHEIGKAFCREYLDDYACTISTHVNTEHCHNHIMQCAYALDGTHKYRDTMEALSRARDISDHLSLRFGLPIILSPQTDRGVSWFEWKKKHDGQSWKQQMRMDIREAAGIADNTADFCRLMKAIGYMIRETENHFTFTMPEAGENGEGYRCRDSRLNCSDDNFDYSKTGIRSAIERRTGKQQEADRWSAAHSFDPNHRGDLRYYATHIYISRYTIDGRQRTALELLFIEALKIITLLRDLFQVKEPPKDHPVYLSHEKKIRLMEDSLAMVQKLGLENRDALSDLLNQTGTALSQLKKQHKSSQPVHAKEQEMLEKIEEAVELIEVMKSYGVDLFDLELHHYGEQEIRRTRAALMPMTPTQRRDLYLALSDSPLYRLRCKYEELTYQEAREVIAFLKGQNSEQPSILFSLDEKDGSGQKMSIKTTESEDDRQSKDTFFLSRLADFPMDKQLRIDRCRELLNELALLGIAPDRMEEARNELRLSVVSFENIERRITAVSEEYRKLKRLEQNLALAANPRFTHGPLFDEKEEKPVERTLVENVDQLRPEDRAEEIKHRYEINR